ncbi:MAG: PhoU domain-containing protein [Thermoplasmatota archaeon]
MQVRKIQMTGGSSYAITLPKEWVEQAMLQAGDVVALGSQPDGSLAVYPGASGDRTTSRFEIAVDGESPEVTFRNIVAAYLMGYDVLILRGRKGLPADARRAVRMAAKRIIGIEVVEEDANSMSLQDFLDPREFHIEKGVRRMHALLRTMQDDSLLAFKGGQPADNLEERDDEVDRLYWMVNKQFHAVLRDSRYAQKMNLNASQALNYLLVARVIERTADHARRIAMDLGALHGGEVHAKLESKIEKQARRSFQLFDEAFLAFLKEDTTLANKILGEVGAFQRVQETLLRESLPLGGEKILHVAYAIESISRTSAYAADVAETAINHQVAMRKPEAAKA